MRWGLFLAVFLFSVSFAIAAIPKDCLESMIAYYKFDGNTVESLGENANGVWSGTPDFDYGRIFEGASFDTNNYVSLPGSDSLDLYGSFTIQFWIRNPRDHSGSLVDKEIYKIEYEYVPGTGFDEEFYIHSTVNGQTLLAGPYTDLDNYYFVTLTWNSGTRALQLYVNAELKNETELTAVASPNTQNVIVGQGFEGIIDELAFFNEWHNVSRIRQNFQRTSNGVDYCYSAGGGGASGTRRDFTIQGCSVPGSSETISVGFCSRDGQYFCEFHSEDNSGIRNTIEEADYCDSEDFLGIGYCCPLGFECDGTCTKRMEDCSTYLDNETCFDAQCFWIEKDGQGTCTETPKDYSCSYYRDSGNCTNDLWNLGQIGSGTEVCGTYVSDPAGIVGYVIPQESCRCEWESESDECVLAYNITPEIYGANPDQFTCLKSFQTGECIDGKQYVNWSVGQKEEKGNFSSLSNPNFDGDFFERIRNETDCKDGELERSCGDPIVKVPFFSFFSLIASIVLITLYSMTKHTK